MTLFFGTPGRPQQVFIMTSSAPGDVEVRLHCDQPSTGLPPTPELCATEGEAEATDLDAMKPDEHSQSTAGCTDPKDIDIEIGSHLAACQG